VVYPIIYRVSTIQGGAGFLPSTVVISRSDSWPFDPSIARLSSLAASERRPGARDERRSFAWRWGQRPKWPREYFSGNQWESCHGKREQYISGISIGMEKDKIDMYIYNIYIYMNVT